MSGFLERLTALGAWSLHALIVTSGGWVLVAVAIRLLPCREIVKNDPRGSLGFVLGLLFVVGTVISATAYWLITGDDGVKRMLGF